MVTKLTPGRGRPIKIRIPTSFQCLGHTIQIVKLPEAEIIRLIQRDFPDDKCEEGVDGLYDHDNKMIYLNESLTYAKLETAYLHEKSHCILEHMGEMELSQNEVFVELMSQVMYQIEKTQRGYLEKLSYRKGVRTPDGLAEFRQRKQRLGV